MPAADPHDPRRLREEELLRRHRRHRDRGEEADAAELWRQLTIRSHDRIVGLVKAFRFPGGQALSPDDAADAAQNAFLRALAMGRRFEGSAVGQFRAALYQCVQNTCMDLGRSELRHARHRKGSLDERYDDGEAGRFDAAIARRSLDEAALAAEAREDDERRRDAGALVGWALARMPNENYRLVLELTVVQSLSAEQVAEQLGITIDNVYARRSRGLKQLEAILRDHRA